MTHTIVTTSWDDGSEHDLTIAEMLCRYSVRATFYVPTRQRRTPCLNDKQLRDLASAFEVGAHTINHVNVTRLTPSELEREVRDGKCQLEQVTGRPARMFCYPRGKYDGAAIRAVRNAGYIGARTTKMGALSVTDPWLMPTSVQAYPHTIATLTRHFVVNRRFTTLVRMRGALGRLSDWAHLACSLFDYALEHGGIWHLYGHSWEIATLDQWDALRTVLSYVSGRKNVTYLSNSETLAQHYPAPHQQALPSCS